MTQHIAHRRQYERRACDVPVQLTVVESGRAQVAPLAGPTVAGRLTDLSSGGAHVIVPTYLPRALHVELEVPPNETLPGGRVHCRIMTIRMVDREPRYGIGLRFEESDGEYARALRAAEEQEAAQ